jgi:transposase InsO family protein
MRARTWGGIALVCTVGLIATAGISTVGAAPAAKPGKSGLIRACVDEATGQMFIRDRCGRAREGATDADGRLEGLVQHSDAGSQYVAFRYTERLTAAGAVASIGTVGDSYDNALAESVIGLYKNECVKHDGPFRTVDDLELGTLSWVHWFNHQRLHSSIGYLTPIEFEKEYYRQNTSRQQPLTGELALH